MTRLESGNQAGGDSLKQLSWYLGFLPVATRREPLPHPRREQWFFHSPSG